LVIHPSGRKKRTQPAGRRTFQAICFAERVFEEVKREEFFTVILDEVKRQYFNNLLKSEKID
jgi:hypothetical protein